MHETVDAVGDEGEDDEEDDDDYGDDVVFLHFGGADVFVEGGKVDLLVTMRCGEDMDVCMYVCVFAVKEGFVMEEEVGLILFYEIN